MADSSGEEILMAEKIAILAGKVARFLNLANVIFQLHCLGLYFGILSLIVNHFFYLHFFAILCADVYFKIKQTATKFFDQIVSCAN